MVVYFIYKYIGLFQSLKPRLSMMAVEAKCLLITINYHTRPVMGIFVMLVARTTQLEAH